MQNKKFCFQGIVWVAPGYGSHAKSLLYRALLRWTLCRRIKKQGFKNNDFKIPTVALKPFLV